MTARTHHRLLVAGVCLLLAGGLSANDGAVGTEPPPQRTAPSASNAQQPSPHFFRGRILRPKTADLVEPPAPPPVTMPEPQHELHPVPPSHADQPPSPPLDEPNALQERPTLETRASPHFFLGHARLQMPIRRPRGEDSPVCQELPSQSRQSQAHDSAAVAASELPQAIANSPSDPPQPATAPAPKPPRPTVALVAEPTKSPAILEQPPQPAAPSPRPAAPSQSVAVQPTPRPNNPAPNASFASLPSRQLAEKQLTQKPAPAVALKPAAVQPVTAQPVSVQQTTLAPERLARLGGSSAPLQPAEVFSAPRPDFFADEIELTGLQTRLPQPGDDSQPGNSSQLTALPQPALQPAAIAPAVASSELADPKLHLAALQQPLPGPAAPLQPAEVLPIPTPYSPAAPRIPTLDQNRPIAALTTNIAPTSGRLPTDVAADHFQGDYPPWASRGYSDVAYYWDAPALCYGPLRFEEVNLERYGYGCCHVLQPFVSAAHFAGATLALPYNMVNRPCWECIAPLGHYRPGSPVPYRKIWPEWNPLAASAECATIAGLILLIP